MNKERVLAFFSNLYVLKKLHLRRSKKRLKNEEFSIISSNCIGGIIYNNLELRFLSPTINTAINSDEFAKMLGNLEYYMNLDPVESINDEFDCPCGKIGDVEIRFVHYSTFEEGRQKWNERKSRINYDNLYIILNDRDGITEEQIRGLKSVKCKNICVFASKDYPDIPYVYHFKNCSPDEVLLRSKITGLRGFETCFDYVKWLNDDNHFGE